MRIWDAAPVAGEEERRPSQCVMNSALTIVLAS